MEGTIIGFGSLCFGLVIGWVTYRTLRRREGAAVMSDISSVIAAVGGGTVTALFDTSASFAWYSIGLAVGFFAYFIVSVVLHGKDQAKAWMGD